MKNILVLGFISCILVSSCNSAARRELMVKDSLLKDSIMMDSLKQTASLATNINLSTKTPADKKFIKSAELKFKVGNVLFSTEKIEDVTVRYGGYVVYSNMQNRNQDSNSTRISRDSLLITKQIVVENSIQLRIPNEKLDSFVRELNPLVSFFDYRVIRLTDITLQLKANHKKSERLTKYNQRQSTHIDTKSSKLKETSSAEDQLLEHQNQTDELQIENESLEDQIKYCNVAIFIYQKPIIIKETIADFDYVSNIKPSFFVRVGDSLVQGWWILSEVIIFLIKIWGIFALIIGLIFGAKYLSRLYKRLK